MPERNREIDNLSFRRFPDGHREQVALGILRDFGIGLLVEVVRFDSHNPERGIEKPDRHSHLQERLADGVRRDLERGLKRTLSNDFRRRRKTPYARIGEEPDVVVDYPPRAALEEVGTRPPIPNKVCGA